MCGIFGIVSNRATLNTCGGIDRLTDLLFRLSESRGSESSGLAVRDPASATITVLKQPVSASRFIRGQDYHRLLGNIGWDASGRKSSEPVVIMGHTRLVTNGNPDDDNNQPVVKNNSVVVHNGIIVNVNKLWAETPSLAREHEVDTEIIPAIIQQELDAGRDPRGAVTACFRRLEGTASVAMLRADWDAILLATNNGSLYLLRNNSCTIVLFSSERYILRELKRRLELDRRFGPCHIEWIHPNTGGFIGIAQTVSWMPFNLNRQEEQANIPVRGVSFRIHQAGDSRKVRFPAGLAGSDPSNDEGRLRHLLVNPVEAIDRLRRCSRCILPETFPFIEYDADGVCNYCRHYQPMKLKGLEALEEMVASFRRRDGQPDCIISFSGGRDSSYGLHYVREVLKMTPIAYTYDWGMVTDLGRRNQARMCGKLGVEHIIVSADIARKRANIRRNVNAWLKRPQLGTVPLFMAGDKQYFYYANLLRKRNGIKLVVLCENMLETTYFKSGFCGLCPKYDSTHTYSLSFGQKIHLMTYYGSAFLCNLSYLNRSMLDTAGAFLSYYAMPHDYLNLYDYIPWREEQVEDLLRNTYGWEMATDTRSSWRIGDGTAAFYNSIYYTVAGFSEIDTFRSNQVREGMLTRDRALALAREENQPRYESLRWYLDTIGIEFESTIRTINAIPRLYRSSL